jgi:hypothetical protein
MGQFSMEIYAPTGSLLSGNLQTGTNRQGELVRTLLNSAAALARNPARGGETPDCGG